MNNIFSPDDFKSWMQIQKGLNLDMRKSNCVGSHVTLGIPKRKAASNMCVVEGNLDELCYDFIKNGGKIVAIDNKNLIISRQKNW